MADTNTTKPNDTVDFTPAGGSGGTPGNTQFSADLGSSPQAETASEGTGVSFGKIGETMASGDRHNAKETIKAEASKLQGQAADKARSLAGDGKAKASGALGDFAQMMNDAAESVDEKLGAQYGDYARSAAGYVSGFADTLDRKDVDELVADARDFVRKSPVMAIGAAAALGFVIARVVKSGIDGSADNVGNSGRNADRNSDVTTATGIGSSDASIGPEKQRV